jgi:serine/threonine protein kinase
MGFMAPEQISGRPGPEADIFAWGVTVAYAATGRSPFGAGNTHAVLYRIMYGDADIATVPDTLRLLVEAALAKDPQNRPTAQQLLDQLTSSARRAEHVNDAPTQVILAQTWQSGSHPSPPSVSRPAEPNRVPPRQPAPPVPAPPVPAPPAAEPPTAGSPVPVMPVPVAQPAEAPPPGKIPVGRRVATIATSALVAMRLRRPGRRAPGQQGPNG